MKYLCLAYGDKSKMEALSRAEMDALERDCGPYVEDLKKSGHLVSDNGLEWQTTVIRPRKGKASVTDGPFVESKEQVGGAFVIEAKDLDEAVRIASRHPAAHLGENLGWGIELRPVADFREQ